MTPHATRDAAVRLVAGGAQPSAVAADVGVHTSTVHNWCKAAGVPSRSDRAAAPIMATLEGVGVDGGTVYFLAAESVDRVKVGFTSDRRTIVKRMASLAYSSPVPVTLMKVIAGSMQGERWLHVRWAEHRHHGEWFTLSAIRADIEAMESVRDVSAEVKAAKACVTCGVYRKNAKRGEAMCRACAGKARRERRFPTLPYEPAPRACADCGTAMKPLSRTSVERGYKPSPLCIPCGMRAAWRREGFARKMSERDAKKRRKCLHCGQDGLSQRAKYHAKCWEAVASTR